MNKMLPIKLCSEHARMPRRGTPFSSGMDLFFAIESPITLTPRETLKVSTGIAMQIPDTHTGLVIPRSSACKNGIALHNQTGVIDPDYTGEIQLLVVNTHYDDVVILQPEIPFFQIVFVRTDRFELEVVEALTSTQRGAGGFGSTDL